MSVWAFVKRVPWGAVVTYGQVANALSPPEGVAAQTFRAFGARWVGGAMARCPEDVPWQRVVNAKGRISVANAARQKTLLEAEGVIFDEDDRIDLNRFRWREV